MKFIGIKALSIASGLTALVAGAVPGLAVAQSSSASLTIDGCSSLTYVSGTTFKCEPITTTPGAPTGCSVSPSSTSLPSSGGSVSLTAGCTGGGAITSTTWTRNGANFSGTFPDALPANSSSSAVTYTYVATFCAGSLCTSASASATVAATVVSPPPPSASCGDLKVIEPYMEGNSAQKKLLFTGDRYVTSGLGSSTTTIAVAEIPVPTGIAGETTLAVFEYGSGATSRKAWLSKTRCDLSATSLPYRQIGSGPVFDIHVGTTQVSGKINMQPGETWYLMVKNEQLFSSKTSCSSGYCDIGIKLYPPK